MTKFNWKYPCYAKSLQSCLTLCDPKDGSLPGSSVRGIFQARVLEWGAIAFSIDKQFRDSIIFLCLVQRGGHPQWIQGFSFIR